MLVRGEVLWGKWRGDASGIKQADQRMDRLMRVFTHNRHSRSPRQGHSPTPVSYHTLRIKTILRSRPPISYRVKNGQTEIDLRTGVIYHPSARDTSESELCGSGETGRRPGLKILWPQGRGGSTPPSRTSILQGKEAANQPRQGRPPFFLGGKLLTYLRASPYLLDMRKSGKWVRSWLAEEMAAYFGVKRDTIYRRSIRHWMPAHKVGELWKFRKGETDQWVRLG